MTTKQRAQLYHELGKMIGAGLHVDRSVELLLEQHPAASMRAWLEGLRRGLAAHLSVSESVRQHTEAAPLEITLLAAGERGGRLEDSFEHLARYYELRQQSKDKAIGALIYPLILLHFGLVFPALPKFFAGEGPSAVLAEIGLHMGIAWALLGGLGFAAWAAVKAAASSSGVDGFLNTIPLVGGVRRHWALARFCQVFQTGLLAAFRMTETLQLAGDASQSARLREAGRSAAHALESGDIALAAAMKRTRVFPKAFMQSVATAEETGTLDREMGRWAVAEAELAAQAQNRLATVIPWILYILIVLYVAARIIGMVTGIYAPLLKMLDET
jgi:type II secretory pathway component PulF